MEQTTFEAIS